MILSQRIGLKSRQTRCYNHGSQLLRRSGVHAGGVLVGKAAIHGIKEAQYNISLCYEKGFGLEKDLQKRPIAKKKANNPNKLKAEQ